MAYSVYDPSGHPVTDVPAMGADKIPLPEPVLPDPATIPRLEGGDATGPDQPVVTVPASDGSFDYFVTSVVAQDGSLVIVGWPMQDVAATLGQLATIEILVTVIVLVAAACVVTWLVALALRPLTGIERTAARIAAGDIGQRIAPVDQRTEVGRLSHTLNTMLGRIEIALAARAASEERLRRLVTDASHELRTPLTSIRGYAELFRRGADERPADLARAMRGIESESERMASLVDDLLLLARLDEGPTSPTTEVDLVPVVRSAVDAARAVEPDRPLAVHLPPRAVVLADAVRMRQVVDNLLANVRVHTPRGAAATVTLRADGSRVVLEVADTGVGMDETSRSRVFERFFRADPSRSRDSGGSGLGLAIVSSIARSYGGEVAVRSEVGSGTTFAVDWPAASTPLDAAGL